MAETTVLPNPLRQGLRIRKTPEPCAMVIFGASGDLTQRKLVPALFYLARERLFPVIVQHLGATGLARPKFPGKSWTRIVIEKPFGRDLGSAESLNRTMTSAFEEKQVYRIDHYLGKETVQNLLVFRFSNGVFEPIWNRNYIDHVQITAAETVGVENRASYYEEAGTMRDMIQNHMLQLLALTAMEPPD